MRRFFKFDQLGTNYRREILAGITTFITMSYIIIVNPAILEAAHMPKDAVMVATILTAFFGTVCLGIYSNRPFAIAPYMGENAFIAYTVVNVLGYTWQTALGAIFVGGVLFTVLTLLRVRTWLVEVIPQSLKYSFAVGIGLFLTLIGLNETGIVSVGVASAPLKLGNIADPKALLAILGFVLIGFLMLIRIRGAILIGILSVTVLSYILGLSETPEKFMSMPPSLKPILLQLDIAGALTWGFFAVILTVFVMDFVDTMGTLIGLSARANLLDERGNLPQIEKPMLIDALSTVLGALLGTTTSGVYIESAAGIEEGGRSGFTSVVTGVLFLLALFFAPFLTAIPAFAYGPALMIVGLLMLEPIKKIDFSDYSELIPAFCTIVLMSFTFNIGIGMTAGFVLYPLFKLLAGRPQHIHPGMWVLFVLSLLFYIFYPYH
ncbi:MAG: NCS2 family permease [candidate division KSB1 bacterium]|nr:NCS2 family permease [candidate division KSB1 bacterium]MDZ7335303.1 NCS2 family permease [candidate division KSB1 bacterium]MDZ7357227.1 NCS2 family permease [candidate division KSB1 bacterium]MDZ7375135.1 NCS2 family permease [candidate division KSB1 bacterium]MDZ7399084.1 NCS2 family permease [candidate division KSB1 bacterium]